MTRHSFKESYWNTVLTRTRIRTHTHTRFGLKCIYQFYTFNYSFDVLFLFHFFFSSSLFMVEYLCVFWCEKSSHLNTSQSCVRACISVLNWNVCICSLCVEAFSMTITHWRQILAVKFTHNFRLLALLLEVRPSA